MHSSGFYLVSPQAKGIVVGMLCIALSALEKAQQVPSGFWLKLVLGIVAFLIAVVVIQRIAKINKMVLGVVIVATLAILGFQWIYNRNEPKFMTPFIDTIAPFFPAKGAYEVRQQQDPGRPGDKNKKPTPTAAPRR